MKQIGLVAAVDSWLRDDSRLSADDVQHLLKRVREHLKEGGFAVHDIGVVDLLNNLSYGGQYVQLTVTEEDEESRAGKVLNYHVPITTVQIRIECPSAPCSHIERIQLQIYRAYSLETASTALGDVMPLVCRRLALN